MAFTHPRSLTFGSESRVIEAGEFTVVETSYAPLRALPRHGHEDAALCFSFRGSFEETVDGQTFEAAPYDVMVRPPAVRHSNRYASTGTQCVLIGVPQEAVLRMQPFTSLFDETRRLSGDAGKPLALNILRELRQHDESSPIVLQGLILELIGASSRVRRSTPPRWLRDARDFIHAHWLERPSLAAIARAGGIHPANLVRGFRAHLRCSPGEYMRRLRLEHARIALASERTIADIALEAGFYDQSHFTSAFRRHFGVTPAAYRLQTRV
ncbi:MAG TPA: AraC family transcriptional regulator [Thermoanaerobaculia bacterium]|nr:AraC family transcriptional regulator [Thermoanaerobaculia bacterium]